MRNLISIILIIAMLTTFMGCTGSQINKNNQSASQKTTQSSGQEHSSTALPIQNIEASILSADEKEMLRKQAIDFAINFPYTFENPSKIPTDSVGWYTFWKLFEKDTTKELQNGYCLLPDDLVNEYVKMYFGIEQLVWTEDIPKYDEKEGVYYFYPVGEQVLIEGEIFSEEFHDNDTSLWSILRLYCKVYSFKNTLILHKNKQDLCPPAVPLLNMNCAWDTPGTSVTFRIVLYRPAMEMENPQREQIAIIDL